MDQVKSESQGSREAPLSTPSEPLVRHVASCRLPTRWAVFQLHGFEEIENGREHVAVSLGSVDDPDRQPVLVRMHSECLTGDGLHSLRCDCGAQLEGAFEAIAKAGCGVIVYLRQEGRGIGLLNKIRAYSLQDEGADTVDANHRLGLPIDSRDYRVGASMLKVLGVQSVRLMTNNPRKVDALQRSGIVIAERVPLRIVPNAYNAVYLRTKAMRLGHLLDTMAEASGHDERGG